MQKSKSKRAKKWVLLFFLGISTTSSFAESNLDTQEQSLFNTYPKSLVEHPASKEAPTDTPQPLDDYTVPLFFDIKNVLESSSLDFEYDFTGKDNLKIGPFSSPEKILKVKFSSPSQMDSSFPTRGINLLSVALFLEWPQNLFRSGRIEMIGEKGQVIWTADVTEKSISNWKETLSEWQQAYNLVSTSPVMLFRLAFLNFKQRLGDYKTEKEAVQFCLINEQADSSVKICSERFFFRNTNDNLQISPRQSERERKVTFNQNEVPLRGTATLNPNAINKIYAEMEDGDSLDYTTKGSNFNIKDISQLGDFYKVIGSGSKPLGHVTDLEDAKPDQSFYEKFNYLEKSIGRLKPKYWSLLIKPSKTQLYFIDPTGVVLVLNLKIKNPPFEKDRLYLHQHTPGGTYKNTTLLFGKKDKNLQIDQGQKDVTFAPETPEYFQWNFMTHEPGEHSKNDITFLNSETTFKANYEVYRGFSGEISARLTGVFSTESEFTPLIEANFGYWFEDLWGWQNYKLSKQRWGLSGKYFQSMGDFKATYQNLTMIRSLALDLKYRNTPGLWNWDETTGGIFSFQNLELISTQVPMLGLGYFWARSMPKIFNDFFNIIPYFRYPKWVDMEFIYYLTALNSEELGSGNYALNFHGKIMLSKKLYGEAGFGLKGFGFKTKTERLKMDNLYGTLGMGMNF